MKHTKLPWHYQEDSDAYTHIIRDESGSRIIAQFRQDTSGLAEANAKLIVKAVNNHESLLDVLKEIEKGMSSHAKELDKFGVIRAIKAAEDE